MNVLTPNNFYKKLKDNSFSRAEIGVNFDVLIDASIVDWEFRIIQNVTFEKIVKIKDVEINSGLAFINCKFKEDIVFSGVKSLNFDSTINPNNYSVLFSSCIASLIRFDQKCNLDRGIVVDKDSNIDNFVFLQSHIKFNGLKLVSSSINNILDISNVRSELNLRFMKLNKNLRIDTLIGDVSFISSTFNDTINLYNLECPNSLTFNDNVFEGQLKIQSSRLKGFYIHGDIFNKKIELENRDLSDRGIKSFCKEIYISEAKFIEGADFNGLSKEIEKITLQITPNLQGVIKFTGWKVDDLYISGVNQNLKLLFKRMIFRFALLNDFTNYNDLSFDKCSAEGDSTFNLSDCDLGAAKFNEFDFNSFKKIRTDNVTLDKIRASNVNWFSKGSLEISSSDGTDIEKYRRIREVYRQIKHALVNSGNQIDSLMFKAREMEAYRSELKSGENYSIEDKLIMTVSRTNNFGLSWGKPTCVIFIITLGFYILMLPLFSSSINYSIASNLEEVKLTFSEIYNNFGVFWQLFNPTRKFSSTFGEIDNGFLYFLDLFQRIVLGVFIFQIIKGFRRLTSK
ncbi:hypothetical protein [Algibacter pacificus]|uniref:hypothetical protein n=1 Tax=Algibacter pacificus TaxID=2599389 RepID=UPI0011CC5F9D|nr:hypothetical protein [Algibacter pacificus]